MNPIYESGGGRGIGHSLSSFHERFDAICREHLQDKRARAFAFIFYDFQNKVLCEILEDQSNFVKLDRLSGKHLSIFYLQSGKKKAVEYFNSHFLNKLGVAGEVTLPCVVFFKLEDNEIRDVEAVHLDSADRQHGFDELSRAIERYIASLNNKPLDQPRSIKWIKNGVTFIGLETFRATLKTALEYFW